MTLSKIKQLFQYIEKCEIEKVKSALDECKSYLDTDDRYKALNIAISTGDLNVVKLLCSEIDYTRCYTGALFSAISNGTYELANFFLEKGAFIDKRDSVGNTALYRAVLFGNIEITDLLLKNAAKVDHANKQGNTCLHIVAYDTPSNKYEIANMLILNKADVNAKNYFWHTPLFNAAKKDDSQMIQLLIHSGASVSLVDRQNATCLHWAADVLRYNTTTLLISKGASVNARDYAEKTPLHKAAFFGNYQMLQALLDNNANIEDIDKERNTCLHIAATDSYSDQYIIAATLISRDLSVNAKNNNHHTPLHIAVFSSSYRMVELLLKNNANVNARITIDSKDKNFCSTALHRAVFCDNPEIISLLLDNNADRESLNEQGKTALDVAKSELDYRKEVTCLISRLNSIENRKKLSTEETLSLYVDKASAEANLKHTSDEDLLNKIIELLKPVASGIFIGSSPSPYRHGGNHGDDGTSWLNSDVNNEDPKDISISGVNNTTQGDYPNVGI